MIMIGMGGIAVLLVLVLAFGWWREYVARSSQPVATVAGTPISIDQYARRLDFQRKTLDEQMQFMQAQLQAAGSNQSIADLYRQQIQQIQMSMLFLPDQALESLINEQLVRQEAARRGIQVTPDEVEAEIAKTFGDQPTPEPAAAPADAAATSEPGATPAPEVAPTPAPTTDVQAKFTEFLNLYGISGSEYRSIAESQLLYNKLQEAMGAEVPTSADQVHARHILVDSEDKAKEIVKKLKDGASWDELAAAESLDTGSKDKGGDLGWFPQGVMVEAFDKAAFELPVNQISDPIQSNYGWHVIEVLEKQQNRPIDQPILDSLKSRAVNDWLQKANAGDDITRSLTDEDKQWVYQKIKWSPNS